MRCHENTSIVHCMRQLLSLGAPKALKLLPRDKPEVPDHSSAIQLCFIELIVLSPALIDCLEQLVHSLPSHGRYTHGIQILIELVQHLPQRLLSLSALCFKAAHERFRKACKQVPWMAITRHVMFAGWSEVQSLCCHNLHGLSSHGKLQMM